LIIFPPKTAKNFLEIALWFSLCNRFFFLCFYCFCSRRSITAGSFEEIRVGESAALSYFDSCLIITAFQPFTLLKHIMNSKKKKKNTKKRQTFHIQLFYLYTLSN